MQFRGVSFKVGFMEEPVIHRTWKINKTVRIGGRGVFCKME